MLYECSVQPVVELPPPVNRLIATTRLQRYSILFSFFEVRYFYFKFKNYILSLISDFTRRLILYSYFSARKVSLTETLWWNIND